MTVTFIAPDEAGLDKYYGVYVGGLGEECGDLGWVAVTHERRRAIAAVMACVRAWGDRVLSVSLVRKEWWRLAATCGCGDTCPHEPDEDDFVEHDSCEFYGLPPCTEERFSWIGRKSDEGDPLAVAVTVMEVET